MEGSDSSKIKEAEVKYHPEQVENPEGLVEEVTVATKSLLGDVTAQSASYATQVEGLVSDPWDALKNLTAGDPLPTSDKTVGETSEGANKPPTSDETAHRELEKANLEETVKAPEPSENQAWWKNCCGLLDFLQSSDR